MSKALAVIDGVITVPAMKFTAMSPDQLAEINAICDRYEALEEVTDVDSCELARGVMVDANTLFKSLDKGRTKLTKPIRDLTKKINDAINEQTNVLTQVVDEIKTGLTEYQRDLDAEKARVAAERVVADEAAFEAGEDEDDVVLDMNVETAPDEGVVKTRKKLVIRMIDRILLPVIYMDPNEPAIMRAIRDGKDVPGVTYEYVNDVVAR